MAISNEPQVLWRPSKEFAEGSNIHQYLDWLAEQKRLVFDDYDQLWEWSIKDIGAFWESIWVYFEVISYSEYENVLSSDQMPHVRWFSGATLNYAEHIFRNHTDQYPALIFQQEGQPIVRISWDQLQDNVSSVAGWLRSRGITKGDRVVAYLPNIPEAIISFLAVNSIGAVWSSCSPDFGSASVVDRFKQIEPKVLIAVDGYKYNGKSFDKSAIVREIADQLPSLEYKVRVPYLDKGKRLQLDKIIDWDELISYTSGPILFEPVPFDHPIWVLYSSGTTGMPKAITHSHGGALLEHLKYLSFHNDVMPGERFFWYTTTGWMMWNYVQASLLLGATVVLYDGSPSFPDLNALWQFASEAKINHFGTSAPFLVVCMKEGLNPKKDFDLSPIRSLSSTGSPLPPEAFAWVYEHIKEDVWLVSMSGGTDVCTAFIGGVPTEPVYAGEIQRRALGCALESFDEMGKPIREEVGEMVITKPMPSMPIYFWNDPDFEKYLSSYFETYPGQLWRHGDWIKITKRNTIIIQGRSDATLNRHGIRIGTAEIYRSINKIGEIKDSLIVNLELEGGRHYMPLFVVMKEGQNLDGSILSKIKHVLRSDYTPRHVPDEVIEVKDIPYTISGKKLEAPVKKLLLGVPLEKAANLGAVRNPESFDFFVTFRDKMISTG